MISFTKQTGTAPQRVSRFWTAAIVVIAIQNLALSLVQAETALIDGMRGQKLTVELVWERNVDLDLFVTDPAGETAYFANRLARSGTRMGQETGCKDVARGQREYKESANLIEAMVGLYRISVDFIKDCGNSSLKTDFDVVLKSEEGVEIGRTRSTVQYRLLNPVAWEFKIQ